MMILGVKSRWLWKTRFRKEGRLQCARCDTAMSMMNEYDTL
jgi:hypothetical protein